MFIQTAKKACLKDFENLVVTKVSMTRVGPFGKVAERFDSQQETRFSVRFPQAFITGFPQACFMPFQKVVKSPPSAEKIGSPSTLRNRIRGEKNPLFKAVLLQTTSSSGPGIEPSFLELERKRNNHYTGWDYTRWDR
ncbi:hypothetical protein AVEN_92094-1 [Araneus ventricosus]|uniref:Uncharacterized protein n=1 Tax=Araneus ventricosus TaxID=182803 RepID=A0A4Y2HHE5_ARAVE|nr:hypothetical protein AVEN_92094-1 [Araneus ventricosus]